MLEPLDTKAIIERKEKAFRVLNELCAGTRHWRISIPARPDVDPDLIISRSLMDLSPLVAEVERLRKVVHAARKLSAAGAEFDWNPEYISEYIDALDTLLVQWKEGQQP